MRAVTRPLVSRSVTGLVLPWLPLAGLSPSPAIEPGPTSLSVWRSTSSADDLAFLLVSARKRRQNRAQERAPLWNDVSSYFSLGEWMRSSSRLKPIISVSILSASLNEPTIGIEPPQPRAPARCPIPACSARRARVNASEENGSADGTRRAVREELGAAIVGQARLDEGAERRGDRLGILVGDETEREFGAGLRRQHGLRALSPYSRRRCVDLAGRARPQHLQHAAAMLARRHRQATSPRNFWPSSAARATDRRCRSAARTTSS